MQGGSIQIHNTKKKRKALQRYNTVASMPEKEVFAGNTHNAHSHIAQD